MIKFFTKIFLFILISTASTYRIEVLRSEFSKHGQAKVEKVWWSSTAVVGRNKALWRLDDRGFPVLHYDYLKFGPLSFVLIVKPNNKYAPLRNIPERSCQKDLTLSSTDTQRVMDLIEIAVVGYISRNDSDPICYVPSQIHQDLKYDCPIAKNWARMITFRDEKLGQLGHNTLFNNVGILWNRSGPRMIHDELPSCSDIIGQVEMRTRESGHSWDSDDQTFFFSEKLNRIQTGQSYGHVHNDDPFQSLLIYAFNNLFQYSSNSDAPSVYSDISSVRSESPYGTSSVRSESPYGTSSVRSESPSLISDAKSEVSSVKSNNTTLASESSNSSSNSFRNTKSKKSGVNSKIISNKKLRR